MGTHVYLHSTKIPILIVANINDTMAKHMTRQVKGLLTSWYFFEAVGRHPCRSQGPHGSYKICSLVVAHRIWAPPRSYASCMSRQKVTGLECSWGGTSSHGSVVQRHVVILVVGNSRCFGFPCARSK